MKTIWMGILVWAMLGIPTANAVIWSEITGEEVKQLPNYCMLKYREKQGDAGARNEGMALMGVYYNNVHHYCSGLNYLNRYYRSIGRQEAGSYLAFAINEFTYYGDQMPPQSPIAAEFLLNRGIAYSLAKKPAKAMSDLQRALLLDPKLARAYITLADEYIKLRNREKALDMVTEGLRHIPDNKALKRRYDEVGGKLPYPEPVIARPAVASEDVQSSGNSDAPTTVQKVIEQPTVPDGAESKSVEQQGTVTTPIGSPKNPYCRFCPD